MTEGGLDFTILSVLYPAIYYQHRIALTESVGMAQLKAEYELRRAKVVALAESFVILGLLSWLSVEYQSNTYMQEWVARFFWPAGVLLNGTLVGLVGGILIGWIVAFYQGKRSREQMILDQLKKIV